MSGKSYTIDEILFRSLNLCQISSWRDLLKGGPGLRLNLCKFSWKHVNNYLQLSPGDDGAVESLPTVHKLPKPDLTKLSGHLTCLTVQFSSLKSNMKQVIQSTINSYADSTEVNIDVFLKTRKKLFIRNLAYLLAEKRLMHRIALEIHKKFSLFCSERL